MSALASRRRPPRLSGIAACICPVLPALPPRRAQPEAPHLVPPESSRPCPSRGQNLPAMTASEQVRSDLQTTAHHRSHAWKDWNR